MTTLDRQNRLTPYRLDVENDCLWASSGRISLTRKSCQVLAYLVTHAERIVSKNELLDAVWANTFVGEGVLKVCVAEIRKALKDSAKEPRYIETVHRQGYRMISNASDSGEATSPWLSSPTERRGALEKMRHCLDRATHGKRQILFITGEQGIGKTTLVEAFLAGIPSKAGLRIAQAHCFEQHGTGEPYFPIFEALVHLSRQIEREPFIQTLRQHAPTWLAQIPSFLTDADRESLGRETLGGAKERMIREFAALLDALTAEAPFVLVLEDLHWSDCSTIDLLAHLARRRHESRLLIACTYRPADVILQRHPLRDLKHDLSIRGHSVEIPLELLSQAGVTEYLRQRFPGSDGADALGRIIHRRTDGNPLFMINIIDHMVAEGAIVPAGATWKLNAPAGEFAIEIPDGIQRMIDKHAERLSEDEQHLLKVASVAGGEFSASTLSAAMEKDTVSVETLCEDLVRKGQFIQPQGLATFDDGSVTGKYGFIHELYRHALYRTIPATRRIQLHRRIGEHLERCSEHKLRFAAQAMCAANLTGN